MPSKRHIELQNMVARWIGNRSFKMCGLPEVGAVGYVADFFALAGIHNKIHSAYAKHSGLKEMYVSHKLKDNWQERDSNDQIDDIINGDIDRWYACVFEVKVSRSDFLNTFGGKDSPHAKARMEPVGTAHWVVADKGICTPDELPDFWGLLTPYGAGLSEKKKPLLNVLSAEKLAGFGNEMLWLQMNNRSSYYEQLRDMSEKIKFVQLAVRHEKPKGEILRCCRQAIEACRGFAG